MEESTGVKYAGSIFHDLQRLFVIKEKQKILKVYRFCKNLSVGIRSPIEHFMKHEVRTENPIGVLKL